MRQEHCCFGVSVSRLRAAHSRPTPSEQMTLRYGILCTRACVCVFLFKMYYISLSYSSVDNWFGDIVLSCCGSATLLFLSLSLFLRLFLPFFVSLLLLCVSMFMDALLCTGAKVISACFYFLEEVNTCVI